MNTRQYHTDRDTTCNENPTHQGGATTRRAQRLMAGVVLLALLSTVASVNAATRPFAKAQTAFFKTRGDQAISKAQKLAVSAQQVHAYVESQVATARDYALLRKEFRRFRSYLAEGNGLATLEQKPEFAFLLLRKELLTKTSDQLTALRRIAAAKHYFKVASTESLRRLGAKKPRLSGACLAAIMTLVRHMNKESLRLAVKILHRSLASYDKLKKTAPRSAQHAQRRQQMMREHEKAIAKMKRDIARIKAREKKFAELGRN